MMKEALIYVIQNTISTRPNDCYVGSSARKEGARKRQHLTMLRRGKHHSKLLQLAFNKYGESSFEFRVIARCNLAEQFARETYWINLLRPRYNMAPVGGSVLGLHWTLGSETRNKMSLAANNRTPEHKRKLKEARAHQILKEPRKLTKMNFPGWRHTEESKISISRSLRLLGPRPPEVRRKISLGNKGKAKTEDHKKKLSMAAKKREMTEERLNLLRTVGIGRRWMNKDGKGKTVVSSDVDRMIADGWKLGRPR